MGLNLKLPSLPKVSEIKPYKRRPLNEHALLTKGALHIKGIEGNIIHPASNMMKTHISNGFFKGEPKGSGLI